MSSFGLVPLPAISRLTSRVWRILGLNPGPYTLQGTNTYLVGTGASRLLIDTGAGVRGYVENVVECMRQSGCERLEAILITHWHHDHTGGLSDLLTYFASPSSTSSRSSSPVSPIGTGSSLSSTASTEDSSLASSTPSSTSPSSSASLASIPVYKHQPHLRGAAPSSLTYLPLTPTSRFTVEGATLTCVATPGHTADHVSFLLTEEHALFIGDTVLGHGTTVFRHLYDYTHTLQAVSRMAPLVLYPGHGAEVADVQGKLAEYLQHRRMREQQLLRVVRELTAQRGAATAVELVGKVYPPLSESVLPAAIQNVTLHLEKLALEGEVASEQMEAETRSSSSSGWKGEGREGQTGSEGGGEEWDKDYGELYESTSAMVQRKSQWKWKATATGCL